MRSCTVRTASVGGRLGVGEVKGKCDTEGLSPSHTAGPRGPVGVTPARGYHPPSPRVQTAVCRQASRETGVAPTGCRAIRLWAYRVVGVMLQACRGTNGALHWADTPTPGRGANSGRNVPARACDAESTDGCNYGDTLSRTAQPNLVRGQRTA